LLKDDNDNFVLLIDRKSRIIMKDANAILEKADKIKKIVPGATITLETTAPESCFRTMELRSFQKKSNLE